MSFYPWSSSSFPISSETGRGLTSISLPGLTTATPPNKLWLLLAFFLLEIFCFTPLQRQVRNPQQLQNPVRTATLTPVCTEYKCYLGNLKTNLGKQGKCLPCLPTLQNPKIPSSSQHKIKFYNPQY